MTASVIVFVFYLAGGIAFAVWGLRAGGRKTVLYPIIEGALSVLGIASALIIFFTFGKFAGRTVEDPEYLEWLFEPFSVYVKAVVAVWAVVAVIGGLRLLIRFAEKRKPGVWGAALDFAAPFIGSAVIFVVAVAARAVFFGLSQQIGSEISAFAVSASFGLRFLLALAALIGRREDRIYGEDGEDTENSKDREDNDKEKQE